MKYKMVLKGTREEIFDALIESLAQEYENAKGKPLDRSALKKGFTFSKDVMTPKDKTIRQATVKLLAYDVPGEYAMEYKSSTYHKISGVSMKQVSEDQVELLITALEEKLKDGEVVKSKGNDDTIKNAPFMLKRQFQSMLKNYRKLKKA